MERSEPTLFPEWLRSTGSVTGAGSSAQHSASTASHSGTLDIPSCNYHLFCMFVSMCIVSCFESRHV